MPVMVPDISTGALMVAIAEHLLHCLAILDFRRQDGGLSTFFLRLFATADTGAISIANAVEKQFRANLHRL